MKLRALSTLALVATLAVGCGQNDRADVGANNAVGTSGDDLTTPTAADRVFVKAVTEAGMAEVELGRMATLKGVSADVRQFGQMMVSDHSKSGEGMKQIAGRYNITPALMLSDDHAKLKDRLTALHGSDFDREYMKAMVDGHETVVDTLDNRTDGTTPNPTDNMASRAINEWATRTLPTTKKHLEAAKQIAGVE
jgi:putative membrane protein